MHTPSERIIGSSVRPAPACARRTTRILVPLDGSPVAESALGVVSRLWSLGRDDVEVTLVGVHEPETLWHDASPSVVEIGEYLDDQRQLLVLDGATVRYEILFGDPVARIIDLASEDEVTLIAMATHGRRGIDRWLNGSVTEEIARRAPCPVLAANPTSIEETVRTRRRRPPRVLVAIEGSETPGELLALADDLARREDATITLLHVAEPFAVGATATGFGVIPLMQALTADETLSLLEPYRGWLEASGPCARRLSCVGTPAATIVAAAREEESDLVVVGARERSALGRWLFASVGELVLRDAPCPVVVQRLTDTLEEGS